MPIYTVTNPTKILGKPAKVGEQFELEEGDAKGYLDDGVIEGPVEAVAGDTATNVVKPAAPVAKPRASAARKK